MPLSATTDSAPPGENQWASLRLSATAGFLLLLSSYSCFVGTLLSIFVPQDCPVQLTLANVTATISSECSFSQNLYINISPYNAFSLAFNFFTVAALAWGFSVEFARDRWILAHFDVVPSVPDDHLKTDLDATQHPENVGLKNTLMERNLYYYRVILLVTVLYAINVIVSGVLVFYFYYQRTVTTFLTSIIIVGQRLANSLLLSRDCMAEVKAASVNMMEPMAFNVVHSQHAWRHGSSGEAAEATAALATGAEQRSKKLQGWRIRFSLPEPQLGSSGGSGGTVSTHNPLARSQ